MNTSSLPFAVALAAAGFFFFVISHRAALARAIAALSVTTGAVAILGHHLAGLSNPAPFGFDLNLSYNTLWNLSRNGIAYCDALGQSTFSVHGFFTLPLLLPVFALGHPAFLNVAHFLIGISAVLPVWLIARDHLKIPGAGPIMAAIFLLLPSTAGFLFVEFQSTILGVPFLLLYLYGRDRGQPFIAIPAAAMAALSHEIFITALLVDGVAGLFRSRTRRLAGSTLVVAFVSLALFLFFRTDLSGISGSRHYASLGNSPFGAVRLAITAPLSLASLVLMPAKLGYVIHLLLPLLFLPLGAWKKIAFAAPELILVLLSDPGDDMYRINCFYSHVSTVGLIYGTILTIERIASNEPLKARLAGTLLVCVFACQFAYSHTPVPHLAKNLHSFAKPITFFETVPFALVPEGARVLVGHRNDVIRFPRRRAFCIDPFLAPLVERKFRENRLTYEFFATRSDTVPNATWTIAGESVGMRIFRTRSDPPRP